MNEFLAVVVTAAIAQLTVLPGEKVQFIIAGLSTRYHPLIVVGAAGTAFAGWTALEIAFGEALKTALPAIVLDGLTAGLFLLFAVMLYRSAPAPDSGTSVGGATGAGTGADADAETDGGLALADEVDLPEPFGISLPEERGFAAFPAIFAMMAAGEFGDKTQLVTIGLAVQYGATPAIWLGEMLVIIPVSLANAYFFHTFSHRFNVRKAHLFGAVLFAFFGLDTVLSIVTGQFLPGPEISVWETIVSTVSAAIV